MQCKTQYTEEVDETGGNRVEQSFRFDSFPEQNFGMWPERMELIAKIIQVAEQLRVSPEVTLGELNQNCRAN